MNCKCEVVCEGCENNERDSDSNTRARYKSVAFYHHTDSEVDGEVQGRPRDCANVGWMSGDCSGSMSKGEMMSAD